MVSADGPLTKPSTAGRAVGERSELLTVLAAELRQHVLRHGLPVRIPPRRSALFELHCVTAHAISDDVLDRAAALDGILRRIIAYSFGDGPDGASAAVLFGFAKGTKGTTLTQRRERCAALRQVHVDHWRKQVEPRLLETVAYELHLLDRHYAPRLPESQPTRPSLEDPDMTREALLRHEAEATILAHMYGFRAQLAGMYLAVRYDAARDKEEHSDLALWEFTQLTLAASQYVELFGEKLMFLGSDDSIQGLLRISGWHPPFTKREATWLGLAFTRAPPPTVGSFLETLQRTEIGRQIHAKWRTQLEAAAANAPEMRTGGSGRPVSGAAES